MNRCTMRRPLSVLHWMKLYMPVIAAAVSGCDVRPPEAPDVTDASDTRATSSVMAGALAPDLDATTIAQPHLYAATTPVSDAALAGPGKAPWTRVPADRVETLCRLDPAALARADELLDVPWVAVRYGQLCHAHEAATMPSQESLSIAKFLGAQVSGAVAYQTRALPRRGRKSGPFSDEDRVDHWLDSLPYNRDAHVAHVLAMVAQSRDVSYGKRDMEYDYFGFVQLDSLSVMLNTALRQDPARLGRDLEQFTQRFVFGPLGIKEGSWSAGLPDKAFGFSWNTNVLDMARLGLLVLRRGMWNGERLIDEAWIERATHPAFEDANTAMGYCTWLNATSHWDTGTMPVPAEWTNVGETPRFPGPCAPVAVANTHPHGLSEAPDCNYGPEHSCEKQFDVGVWQSIAGFGKVIQGHPGLDLLLVAWDLTPDDFFGMGASSILWNAVRPAVIAADPTYRGDEASFCAAYGENRYAPDLR